MKKLVWLLVLMMLCTGCGNEPEPVYETIADEIAEPVAAEPKPMAVWLPEEAAAQTMAGLFAAKEAVLKALGTGMTIPMTDIVITHTELGQPFVTLQGKAAEFGRL